MSNQVDDRTRLAGSVAHSRNLDLGQRLLMGGGLLGAVAASSCCLVPLALFGIGVGGAWIGYLTRIAPYQPYFIGIAGACLGVGSWLRRHSRVACSEDQMCARPLPNRMVTTGFIIGSVLIVAVLALDLLAPLFL